MKLVFLVLITSILFSCDKEPVTYTIKGVFSEDCDQQIPIDNEEFSLWFETPAGFNTKIHDFPFTTDEQGRFEFSYFKKKAELPIASWRTERGNVTIVDYLQNIPGGQDVDLGNVTLGYGFSFKVKIQVENSYFSDDTLFVDHPTEIGSYIELPGPFKDTVLGPFNFNGRSMHLIMNDGTVGFDYRTVAYLNLSATLAAEKTFQDYRFIDACKKGHTFTILVK
jgi:hypothetical protein